MPLTAQQLVMLQERARDIRVSILQMLAQAGSGHSGGALGLADLYTALYFALLRHNPQQPTRSDRDYLLVSNGHTNPVWYATLAEAGYFPKEELLSLRQLNTRLQGHPVLNTAPGIENTSGSLGQGLSQAAGLALGLRLDSRLNHIHCILSDGEHQEGQTWEAYQFAAHHQLDHLYAWIDRNNIQIEGTTDTQLNLEPFSSKLRSFGWHTQVVNGHDFANIIEAYEIAQQTPHKPHAFICLTVPGRGVPEMEGDYHWHGKPPSAELAQQAIERLQHHG